MKRMDEMDRNIQLRSEEWGFRAMLIALIVWVLYNCWQTLAKGAPYQPVPTLIMCLGVCVQSFTYMGIKQKMTSGDEEYHEPNRLLQSILAALLISVLILALGTYIAVMSR